MTQIYLDNDGVLANFDEHVKDLFGQTPREMGDEKLWENINSYPEFWMSIVPMDDAYELWNFVVGTGIPFCVLTGCPKSNYEYAASQKPLWVAKHFGDVEVITCLSKHKQVHMKNPGDILIDDFVVNIRRWEKAGGIAIKHYNAVDTIKKLTIILDNLKEEKNIE
jgi:hypothetical protein